MRKETVARDNAMFFIATVGMSLGMDMFAQAVLNSFLEMAQFSTDVLGYPGYIRINSSAVRENNSWFDDFVKKVKDGLLVRLSYEFSSATKFSGDLDERVTLEKENYAFCFSISQYERDRDHGFKIIDPDDLDGISENEKLGRVVYLTILPDQ